MLHQMKKFWAYRNRAPEIAKAFVEFPLADGLKLVRSYLGLGTTAYPMQVKTKSGFALQLESVSEVKVVWHIFVRRCYSVPVDCENIIDAGANVGIFAIYAAATCPKARIFSLEPFPSTFRALSSNVERNRLQNRVHALALGLSGESGKLAMRDEQDSTARKIVDPAQSGGDAIEWVPVMTLMEFQAQHAITTIDFLKIDIEGSEWPVVLQSPPELWQNVRHLQLEYHSVNAGKGYHPQMLVDHLQRGGHRVMEHTEDAFHTGMIRTTLQR